MAVAMRINKAAPSRAARPARATVVVRAQKVQFGQAAASVLAAGALLAGSANAITYDQLQGLSYLQVKGSGIAATCPVLESGSTNLKELKSGSYKLQNFCVEPTSILVKEENAKGESEFVKTKLMTRLTYVLDGMTGSFNVDGAGNAAIKEEDGIDYAATTVQLPGGERVPFLFTVRKLEGKGPLDAIKADFLVASYRGSTFLDPKGRGASTGYDNAVALPAAADAEELLKENIKNIKPSKGSGVFSVAKVDASTGEIAGVFETIQPSDTDMGAKVPKDLKISGIWYAQLQ